MALHWQPRDGNPVEEFRPEPFPSLAPIAAPAQPAFTARRDAAGLASLLDALLLIAGGVAIGALLFAVYWTLR